MLKSVWVLIVLGVVLGTATTVGVLMLKKDSILSALEKHEPKMPEPANAPRDWIMRTEEIDKLTADLKQEKEALEERQKELELGESRVAAEREGLLKIRAEVDAMRREVTDNIPKLQVAEKQNVKNLAKTYATMKPADAVAVLREMDDQTIVKILASMKSDVVGAIFQEMTKAKDSDGTLAARAAHLSDRLRLVQNEAKATPQP